LGLGGEKMFFILVFLAFNLAKLFRDKGVVPLALCAVYPILKVDFPGGGFFPFCMLKLNLILARASFSSRCLRGSNIGLGFSDLEELPELDFPICEEPPRLHLFFLLTRLLKCFTML
jgi:hypothetical protein